MKCRILIRAFTARRDVMALKLLQAQLENSDCEVIVASIRQFETALKFWRPDAVIINVPGLACHIKEIDPECQVIYLPGEGAEVGENTIAHFWRKNPEQFFAKDLVLLWGGETLEICKSMLKRWDLSKLKVVGNPKLDMVHFIPKAKNGEKRKIVGFAGRFSTINHHEGIPVIRALLPEREAASRFTFAGMYGFYTMLQAIKVVLENTDLNVSIRPHPNESVDNYYDFVIPHFGEQYKERLEIDASLCIVHWLNKINVMVAPTSTSLYEATLMNIPVISLDKLSPAYDLNRSEAPNSAYIQDSMTMPSTYEDLSDLIIHSENIKVEATSELKDYLHDYHLWPRKRAATALASNEIISYLSSVKSRRMAISKSIIQLWDSYAFYRLMKKNRLHWNFNYHESMYSTPKYFNIILKNIQDAEKKHSKQDIKNNNQK